MVAETVESLYFGQQIEGKKKEVHWELSKSFETSNPATSDKPLPTKSYLLTILKQFHE